MAEPPPTVSQIPGSGPAEGSGSTGGPTGGRGGGVGPGAGAAAPRAAAAPGKCSFGLEHVSEWPQMVHAPPSAAVAGYRTGPETTQSSGASG